MKLTAKNYKISKTKNYIKKNTLFFFFSGINRSSDDWILVEQGLKNINFNYYKVFNKTAIKTLNESVFNKMKQIINGISFFIKPNSNFKTLSRQILLHNFEPLTFIMLAIKLNNKIYSVKQLKTTNSPEYNENKLLLYQFGITNVELQLNSK